MKIELGDKVRCKITGFVGTAVARTEFLNGCVQYNIVPKCKKGENKMTDEIGIDEQSLEVIPKKKEIKIKKSDTGGANTKGLRQRGY